MAVLKKAEIENIRAALRYEMHQHLPKWRLLAEYISPKRLKENSSKTDGRRRDQNIINNQAGRSLRTFVSGMMNGATPRSRPWFNLTSNNLKAAKDSEVKKYYKESEQILNSHFQVGNLYRVLPMVYKDIGTFSNSAFAMLPHARYGFYFYPFAVGTYAWACNREGVTNMFTRDFTLTIREVVETYGQLKPNGQIDWKNIPYSVKRKWEQAHYLETVLLSQVIIPNNTFDPTKKSLNPADKKFQSYTYIQGYSSSGSPATLGNQSPTGFREEIADQSETKDNPFIRISGYDYFPVITPRWEVEPEGFYGIDGPGEVALADIMTLQREEKFRFEGIEKLVRPPMVGHSSMRRFQSSILAGGITYVDDRGMNLGFKPAFEMNPQLSELIASKEEIQSYIKIAFYEDLFRQLSSEQKVSHVTKAEIDQRTAETMAAMAPVLGQQDHDLSGPVIENAMFILEQQGRLPVKPKALENANIIPEYISVLAQASKASLITTQERFLNFITSTSAALQDPSLLRIVKGEDQVRMYAENAGVDPDLLLNEREYKAVQEAAMQAQAMQAQMAAQAAQAQNAKVMSETKLGNGSMLDQQMGA